MNNADEDVEEVDKEEEEEENAGNENVMRNLKLMQQLTKIVIMKKKMREMVVLTK